MGTTCHLNLHAEQQELGKRSVPHSFHHLGCLFSLSIHKLVADSAKTLGFSFYLDFSIFSIPQLFVDSAKVLRFSFLVLNFSIFSIPRIFLDLQRFPGLFFNLSFSIFSIPQAISGFCIIDSWSNFSIWTFLHIPRLFLDSAQIPGVFFQFGLFYL